MTLQCYGMHARLFEGYSNVCDYSGKTCPFIEDTWDYAKENCKYLIKIIDRNDSMLKGELKE